MKKSRKCCKVWISQYKNQPRQWEECNKQQFENMPLLGTPRKSVQNTSKLLILLQLFQNSQLLLGQKQGIINLRIS
jgi:hypothetical protein